jgi:hypothetical protein
VGVSFESSNRLYRIEDCWQETGTDGSSTPTAPEGKACPARFPEVKLSTPTGPYAEACHNAHHL